MCLSNGFVSGPNILRSIPLSHTRTPSGSSAHAGCLHACVRPSVCPRPRVSSPEPPRPAGGASPSLPLPFQPFPSPPGGGGGRGQRRERGRGASAPWAGGEERRRRAAGPAGANRGQPGVAGGGRGWPPSPRTRGAQHELRRARRMASALGPRWPRRPAAGGSGGGGGGGLLFVLLCASAGLPRSGQQVLRIGECHPGAASPFPCASPPSPGSARCLPASPAGCPLSGPGGAPTDLPHRGSAASESLEVRRGAGGRPGTGLGLGTRRGRCPPARDGGERAGGALRRPQNAPREGIGGSPARVGSWDRRIAIWRRFSQPPSRFGDVGLPSFGPGP